MNILRFVLITFIFLTALVLIVFVCVPMRLLIYDASCIFDVPISQLVRIVCFI